MEEISAAENGWSVETDAVVAQIAVEALSLIYEEGLIYTKTELVERVSAVTNRDRQATNQVIETMFEPDKLIPYLKLSTCAQNADETEPLVEFAAFGLWLIEDAFSQGDDMGLAERALRQNKFFQVYQVQYR